MQCPACSGTNVLKCAVAYQQGTTTGTAKGDGVHDANMTVTTITDFAKSAAPPSSGIKAALLWTALWLAIAWIFTTPMLRFSSGGPSSNTPAYIAGTLAAIGALALAWFIKSLPKHNQAVSQWQKSWICRSCGEKFIPQ